MRPVFTFCVNSEMVVLGVVEVKVVVVVVVAVEGKDHSYRSEVSVLWRW